MHPNDVIILRAHASRGQRPRDLERRRAASGRASGRGRRRGGRSEALGAGRSPPLGPSLAPIFGASFQKWEGAVASQTCAGCTLPSPTSQTLRPSADGNDRDVTPYFGGNLELMTPELPIPGRPRLFVG